MARVEYSAAAAAAPATAAAREEKNEVLRVDRYIAENNEIKDTADCPDNRWKSGHKTGDKRLCVGRGRREDSHINRARPSPKTGAVLTDLPCQSDLYGASLRHRLVGTVSFPSTLRSTTLRAIAVSSSCPPEAFSPSEPQPTLVNVLSGSLRAHDTQRFL